MSVLEVSIDTTDCCRPLDAIDTGVVPAIRVSLRFLLWSHALLRIREGIFLGIFSESMMATFSEPFGLLPGHPPPVVEGGPDYHAMTPGFESRLASRALGVQNVSQVDFNQAKLHDSGPATLLSLSGDRNWDDYSPESQDTPFKLLHRSLEVEETPHTKALQLSPLYSASEEFYLKPNDQTSKPSDNLPGRAPESPGIPLITTCGPVLAIILAWRSQIRSEPYLARVSAMRRWLCAGIFNSPGLPLNSPKFKPENRYLNLGRVRYPLLLMTG
ncbi:hypothetical protein AAG570_002028 [Ranatra chinensis]|uniref:Uncharacterized protein n=1 Tax=Ranatra chinensis TaxID=642074 RepID=A0ABD0YST7_9HEMI